MEPQNDIAIMLKELSQSDLKTSQAVFVSGLRKWFKRTGNLSPKQYYCLRSMYEAAFTKSEFTYQLNAK
jgi:hypothetical protein